MLLFGSELEEEFPVLYHMWFITVVFWMGSIFFCLGPIAALILFVARCVKYPEKSEDAARSIIFQIGLIVFLFLILVFLAGIDDRRVKKYLDNNDIDGATSYISEHYSTSYYSYYKKMADVYECVGDYDSAARMIMDYCNLKDLSTIDSDARDRLLSYRNEVSDTVGKDIEKTIAEIERDKKDTDGE